MQAANKFAYIDRMILARARSPRVCWPPPPHLIRKKIILHLNNNWMLYTSQQWRHTRMRDKHVMVECENDFHFTSPMITLFVEAIHSKSRKGECDLWSQQILFVSSFDFLSFSFDLFNLSAIRAFFRDYLIECIKKRVIQSIVDSCRMLKIVLSICIFFKFCLISLHDTSEFSNEIIAIYSHVLGMSVRFLVMINDTVSRHWSLK